jgi:spore coat protein CotH
MNKFISLITFAVITLSTFSQGFYDINTINTIEITFEESNWDQILDQYALAGDEERLMGSVSINGVVYDSVGVRYKGNSTYNPNQVKNPLNIKLDYIINDQEIEGYGTIKLANGFKDPTFVREVLSYEIARNYFPASQSNYANVYINGMHLGLYTNDQSVDKFFAQSHFGSRDNAYFKGEITASGQPTGGVWEYYGQDSSDYYSSYALESDFGWQELIHFTDTLSNHNEYVDQVLNLDRHLWFIAFSNLFVNLDGPINNPQNHYLYKDDNGRFNPIPWDLNESFGVFRSHQTLGNLDNYGLQHLDPYANSNENEFPIISKILSNDLYKKMYVAHMKTIIEEQFLEDQYLDRALELQDLIDADVQADQNKLFTYADFLNNVYNQVGGGPMAIIGMQQLMTIRIDYLMGLSDFSAIQPSISNVNYSPEQVNPSSTVWINAEIENETEVYLKYRNSIYDVFEETMMYDDGNHEDGAANDGVYGASLVASHTDIQYYIYAENSDAAAFFPARAEYEFLNIPVSGSLVINEFMADNETTIADQDGDFDDWIELYNNSEEAINLEGYYLTDDPNEINQWVFPDTSIAAGGYLVVWADKDEEQEGLHSNFKLSADGESIILSDANLNPIDEIEFEVQQVDISYGRYPNGTGSFNFMSPTFAAENMQGILGVEEWTHQLNSLNAYPNPFNEELILDFYLETSSEISVQFFDVLGRSAPLLIEKSLPEGYQNIRISTSQLQSGLWICQLQTENEKHSVKLMKY